MDDVGVICSIKKCLLSVWEAMKGDVYMHFAVTQVGSLDSLCPRLRGLI